jgi:hypothetical protein
MEGDDLRGFDVISLSFNKKSFLVLVRAPSIFI